VELKRKTKAARRSYRTTGDHELRQSRLNKYREIKPQFEKELREHKKRTWNKFVEDNLSLDPWGTPYKIVMSKIITKGTLNTLKNDNGQYTTSWKHITELLFAKLFPNDLENEDNEQNTLTREESKTYNPEQ